MAHHFQVYDEIVFLQCLSCLVIFAACWLHPVVLSLKRLWTGEMTNARLIAELKSVKPSLILLGEESVAIALPGTAQPRL